MYPIGATCGIITYLLVNPKRKEPCALYYDKHLIRKISRVFEGLSAPIRLLDAQGTGIVPEDAPVMDVPAVVMAPGINYHQGEQFYRALDMNPQVFLCCADTAPGVEDVLCAVDAMLMSMFKSNLSVASNSDVYRRALKQELSGAELIARAGEHQIPLELDRSVMLFQMENTEKQSAYSLLGELIPLTDSDVLVELSRHDVALIKDMNSVDGTDELTQFALAVQETLMVEAVQTTLVGVGDPKHTLAQLGESYQEAKRALEVGHVFRNDDGIYVFHCLMLERFLMDIPREESLHYHSLLFNRKTAKLFNDEMLQTVEMFFRKDLNLSDTARQLYIHRNTLVYRLDKVQRQTGLDLRRFEDAVTFKILYELQKCGQEKPKAIY